MTWTRPDREVACGPSQRTIEMAYRPLSSADQVRGLWMNGPWAATPESVPSRGQWQTISREIDMIFIPRDLTTGRSLSSESSSWPSSFLAVSFAQATVVALFRVVGGKVKCECLPAPPDTDSCPPVPCKSQYGLTPRFGGPNSNDPVPIITSTNQPNSWKRWG